MWTVQESREIALVSDPWGLRRFHRDISQQQIQLKEMKKWNSVVFFRYCDIIQKNIQPQDSMTMWNFIMNTINLMFFLVENNSLLLWSLLLPVWFHRFGKLCDINKTLIFYLVPLCMAPAKLGRVPSFKMETFWRVSIFTIYSPTT